MALRPAPPAKTRSGAGVYLMAAAVAAGLGGCTAGRGVPHERASILLVTLGSTRADHLEPYGAHLASTPTLRRLAAEGVLFQRAYAPSPFSGPSDATLLTGLNPPAHGLREDFGGRLPEGLTTLTQRLDDAGVQTLGFTGSPQARAIWGLDRGFSVFVDSSAYPDGQADAADVVDAAIRTLDRREGPVFAWVELPMGGEGRGGEGADWGADAGYDREIAAMDAELGRLLSFWERRFPDSVQVFAGDHGASLGESGEAGSGALLTDATLRVPMILRGIGAASDRVPVGEVVDDPVGVIDVAPTLLSLVDLRAPRAMEGDDLLDEGSDEIYHESVVSWSQLGLAPLSALTDETGRYVEGAWGAFYPAFGDRVSLEADPSRPVSELAERLADLREDMGAGLAEEVLASDAPLPGDLLSPPGRQDPRNAPELFALADGVADRLSAGQLWVAEQRLRQLESLTEDAWGAVSLRAQLALRQGRLSEAVALLVELYERQPLDGLALQIGATLSSAGRWEEAAAWYDQALSSRPDDVAARAGRARVAVALGDLDGAELLLVDAPEDEPGLLVARAELLVAQGRAGEALPLAEAALAQDPTGAAALAAVAGARWELGDADTAMDLIGEALAAERYDLGLRARAATWMLERGKADDAARLMAPAAQLAPQGGLARDLYDATRRAAGEGWPG